jgi:hypothetical protein
MVSSIVARIATALAVALTAGAVVRAIGSSAMATQGQLVIAEREGDQATTAANPETRPRAGGGRKPERAELEQHLQVQLLLNGSDEARITAHELAHITYNRNGEISVNFDTLRLDGC